MNAIETKQTPIASISVITNQVPNTTAKNVSKWFHSARTHPSMPVSVAKSQVVAVLDSVSHVTKQCPIHCV